MTTTSAPKPTTANGGVATAVADPVDGPCGSAAARRRTLALGLLVSAQFVVMLDTSIVNVALPSIQADLGLAAGGRTWVVNAYVLAFGGLLLLSGRAADLFGRRRMFVAGSALFTIGTLLAAVGRRPGAAVAGRIVQGVGAAALSPAAMSLLLLTFPGQARARAMSIWGAASALGGATGVLLGGVLAGTFGLVVGLPRHRARLGRRRRPGPRVLPGAPTVPGAASTGSARPPSPAPSSPSSTAPSARRPRAGPPTAVLAELRPGLMSSLSSSPRSNAARRALVPLELFRSRSADDGCRSRRPRRGRPGLHLRARRPVPPAGPHLAPRAGRAGDGSHLAHRVRRLPRTPAAAGARPGAGAHPGGRARGLAAGHLWLGARTARAGYPVAVLPGLLLVATGSRSASRPPPWSSPRPRPRRTPGWRPA